MFVLDTREVKLKENWKNSNFNHKEPDPASCTSCELGVVIVQEILVLGYSWSGCLVFVFSFFFFFKQFCFRKHPLMGQEFLSRMWLGNTVRVVPQVQTLLTKTRETCLGILCHSDSSLMLGEFTCAVKDLGQVTGLKQAGTIFHMSALSTSMS